jgi:hypothetical protein
VIPTKAIEELPFPLSTSDIPGSVRLRMPLLGDDGTAGTSTASAGGTVSSPFVNDVQPFNLRSRMR